MKLFAHRGNTKLGKKGLQENSLAKLNEALEAGYCVECDVRLRNGKLWLGHDEPQEMVSKEFLIDSNVLVHAKTLDTFEYLGQFKNIHSFYQDKEDVVFSNKGIRIYNQSVLNRLGDTYIHNIECCIFVDLHMYKSDDFREYPVHGVITDCPDMFPKKYLARQREPKALIVDVDGVMTNGKKIYDRAHDHMYKEFCDKDFTAIKQFQSAGIQVIALTGDEFNKQMCGVRGIPYYNAKKFSNQLDKTIAFEEIIHDRRLSADECAYIGDDYYDISLLSVVGFPFCPSDAIEDIKKMKRVTVLESKGGDNVLAELITKFPHMRKRHPYES